MSRICCCCSCSSQSLAEEASMLEQQLNKKLAQSEKVMAELAKLAELETPENKDDLQVTSQRIRARFCS